MRTQCGVLAILLVGLLVGMTACELPHQRSVSPQAPKLSQYTSAQIEEEAMKLLVQLEVHPDQRQGLLGRLREYLADPLFAPSVDSPGVNGVGVFQASSGAFLVKGGGGGGLVSFAGGNQDVRFKLGEFSIGANIGGQGTTGVLLVVGLDHQEKFPDLYTTIGTGGTIGDTSFKVGTASPERGTHVIQLVESSVGFSGEAGRGKLTITVD